MIISFYYQNQNNLSDHDRIYEYNNTSIAIEYIIPKFDQT